MTDARSLARAYLEQQRKLGTDGVVLPARQTIQAPEPESPGSRPGSVNPATEKHGAEPQLTPGVSRGLPEVEGALPPPGISYDPPTGDLFTKDPIREAATLQDVAALIASCTKCRLCEQRAHTVPGEGASDARLVVVGEGPGRTEDQTGRPFVGRAGELLTKILEAIKLSREQVFICNIVKCWPPDNRTPQYDEVAACIPYLWQQLELLKPKVILAMGSTAAQSLLDAKGSLGSLRNHIHRFRGVPVVVTYHPAALLRNPHWKKPTWDDVRIARRLLDA